MSDCLPALLPVVSDCLHVCHIVQLSTLLTHLSGLKVDRLIEGLLRAFSREHLRQQEVQQSPQLVHAVLQRRAREQDTERRLHSPQRAAQAR